MDPWHHKNYSIPAQKNKKKELQHFIRERIQSQAQFILPGKALCEANLTSQLCFHCKFFTSVGLCSTLGNIFLRACDVNLCIRGKYEPGLSLHSHHNWGFVVYGSNAWFVEWYAGKSSPDPTIWAWVVLSSFNSYKSIFQGGCFFSLFHAQSTVLNAMWDPYYSNHTLIHFVALSVKFLILRQHPGFWVLKNNGACMKVTDLYLCTLTQVLLVEQSSPGCMWTSPAVSHHDRYTLRWPTIKKIQLNKPLCLQGREKNFHILPKKLLFHSGKVSISCQPPIFYLIIK